MLHTMNYIKNVWFQKIHLHSRLAFNPQTLRPITEPNGGIQAGFQVTRHRMDKLLILAEKNLSCHIIDPCSHSVPHSVP
jgi:hypothetical protein